MIDLDYFVDLTDPSQAVEGAGLNGESTQPEDERTGQCFVDKRTLARPANTADRRDEPQGDVYGHILEVVSTRPDHPQALGRWLGAPFGNGQALLSGQVRAGLATPPGS